MEFIQLPPSQGYKYVVVLVCMFSHWTETFPCCRVIALLVGKILLEKIISTWSISSELHSNQGTHFTGQVIQSICKTWPFISTPPPPVFPLPLSFTVLQASGTYI